MAIFRENRLKTVLIYFQQKEHPTLHELLKVSKFESGELSEKIEEFAKGIAKAPTDDAVEVLMEKGPSKEPAEPTKKESSSTSLRQSDSKSSHSRSRERSSERSKSSDSRQRDIRSEGRRSEERNRSSHTESSDKARAPGTRQESNTQDIRNVVITARPGGRSEERVSDSKTVPDRGSVDTSRSGVQPSGGQGVVTRPGSSQGSNEKPISIDYQHRHPQRPVGVDRQEAVRPGNDSIFLELNCDYFLIHQLKHVFGFSKQPTL